jgi:hypothetical protein
MPMPAGYSGTPLFKKLGIKSGMKMALVREPDDYWELLPGLPDDVTVADASSGPVDLIHIFVTRRADLAGSLPRLMQQIEQRGTIWVSWPKKSSNVPTDVTEDVIREVALPIGLVDVKVCAVDSVWSGLKLVIRKSARR